MRHLGCEIEFMSTSNPCPSVGGFSVDSEYYANMYEINSFHERAKNVGTLVNRLHRYVDRMNEALSYYNPRFEEPIPIHNGVVFTGVHLHVQSDEHIPRSTTVGSILARKLSGLVVSRIAKLRGLSLRQVLSHHCWGHYRGMSENELSTYADRPEPSSWRCSRRYRPVLWNRTHQTFELRFIDYDMLLPENKAILVAVLKDVFRLIEGKMPRDEFESLVDDDLVSRLAALPVTVTGDHEITCAGNGSIGLFFERLLMFMDERGYRRLFTYSPMGNTVCTQGVVKESNHTGTRTYYITFNGSSTRVYNNNGGARETASNVQRRFIHRGLVLEPAFDDQEILGEDVLLFKDGGVDFEKIGLSPEQVADKARYHRGDRDDIGVICSALNGNRKWAGLLKERIIWLDFEEEENEETDG